MLKLCLAQPKYGVTGWHSFPAGDSGGLAYLICSNQRVIQPTLPKSSLYYMCTLPEALSFFICPGRGQSRCIGSRSCHLLHVWPQTSTAAHPPGVCMGAGVGEVCGTQSTCDPGLRERQTPSYMAPGADTEPLESGPRFEKALRQAGR